MPVRYYLGALALALTCGVTSFSAQAADEVNVAYFLEWPSANQRAQIEKTYDTKLGTKVNWKAFDNGNAMTAAMVAGDVDISYSQGLVPYVLAVSKGVDIELIGVAMTYAENDNCVVRRGTGITKANAKELEGKKVGTLIGNVTHYKLLRTLKHLGVDAKKVNIVSMENSDVPSALIRGDITMGCGFGGSLERMKEYGDVLMTGAEQEAIGLKVFDIISVTTDFAKKHPDIVTGFMQITEDENRAYNKNPSAFYSPLTKASGMDRDAAVNTLKKFTFLSLKEELSKDWMGGGIAKFIKEVADFYVANGQLPKALSEAQYAATINSSFLKKVK